jgi:hypothetical protein
MGARTRLRQPDHGEGGPRARATPTSPTEGHSRRCTADRLRRRDGRRTGGSLAEVAGPLGRHHHQAVRRLCRRGPRSSSTATRRPGSAPTRPSATGVPSTWTSCCATGSSPLRSAPGRAAWGGPPTPTPTPDATRQATRDHAAGRSRAEEARSFAAETRIAVAHATCARTVPLRSCGERREAHPRPGGPRHRDPGEPTRAPASTPTGGRTAGTATSVPGKAPPARARSSAPRPATTATGALLLHAGHPSPAYGCLKPGELHMAAPSRITSRTDDFHTDATGPFPDVCCSWNTRTARNPSRSGHPHPG